MYNEDRFKGLDFLLYAAGQHNVKLIPVFVNQWQNTEGAQWVRGCVYITGHQPPPP